MLLNCFPSDWLVGRVGREDIDEAKGHDAASMHSEDHVHRYGGYSGAAEQPNSMSCQFLILRMQGKQVRSHLWLQKWSHSRAKGRALHMLGPNQRL